MLYFARCVLKELFVMCMYYKWLFVYCPFHNHSHIYMSLFTDLIPTLITNTPAEGRELAIMMARKTIATIQTDPKKRQKMRPDYDEDTAKLMQAAQIVAIEFQTIAAANNYWRDK